MQQRGQKVKIFHFMGMHKKKTTNKQTEELADVNFLTEIVELILLCQIFANCSFYNDLD